MSLQDAAIAANRFGLGARPGDLKVIAGDPRGWLKAQLTPEPALPAPLAALPPTADDVGAFQKWIKQSGLTGSINAYTKAPAQTPGMGDGGAMPGAQAGSPASKPGFSVEQSFIAFFGPRYAQALAARFQVATTTDRPYFERLTHFWGNHFTVSSAKPVAQALPPSFERDVARKHAMDHFEAMLIASCTHPGMLIYLDNYISVGRHSVVGMRPDLVPKQLRELLKGLNENLAREVLELHTLGVRSGYTQDDVIALANILTGFTVAQDGKGGGETGLFRFQPYAHEPGPQTLLGQKFPQQDVSQGAEALTMLARHPATAKLIATKLVRHFIADDPPPEAVDIIAKVFQVSIGDLKSVCTALVDLPQAWDPTPRKMKPPEQYLISAVRGMGGPPLNGMQLAALLGRMGQRPYYAAGPNGWADVEGEWIGPDPVWKRLEWASTVSKYMATASGDPAVLGDALLGPGLTEATRKAIQRAESPAQGLAILLVSPEFQRR